MTNQQRDTCIECGLPTSTDDSGTCNDCHDKADQNGDIDTDLRFVLSELITAGGDLDAAIDGTTDQFDAERKRLNAGLRAAQAVLDGSTEIGLHELLASRRQIAVVWSIEDVQEVRPDLCEDQAWEVLQDARHSHDCNYGINWLTLETIAEILFGAASETAAEEE